jgi:hypothetical protein
MMMATPRKGTLARYGPSAVTSARRWLAGASTSTIVCGFKARLYPTAEQADRLNQWAGRLRFLRNHLLEAEQAEYAISKKFIPKAERLLRACGYEL